MARTQKKNRARRPMEDYGEPVITRSEQVLGEIVTPVGDPLLQAGIAYKQALSRKATATEQKKALKALQRQRLLIALLNRPNSSLKTRLQVIQEMEKSGWALSPYWEKIEERAFWGAKAWKSEVGERWLKRLDKWDPNDDKEGEKLAVYLARKIQALLDANQEFAEQIVRYWDLVGFEFFKFMAFENYGIEKSKLWELYRDYCYVRKPKGYQRFIYEPGIKSVLESKVLQESEGKGLLAAGDAVNEARNSLLKKTPWELLRNWKTLEGYIVRTWQRKVEQSDSSQSAQQQFERRLVFTAGSDEAVSPLLLSNERQQDEEECGGAQRVVVFPAPGDDTQHAHRDYPTGRRQNSLLKAGKMDPDYGPHQQQPDELVDRERLEEVIEEIKTLLPTRLHFTFETLMGNPSASNREIAFFLHCSPDTVDNRREQIRDRLPPGLQRLLKELLS